VLAALFGGAGGLYAAAKVAVPAERTRRLLSAHGLAPAPGRYDELFTSLRDSAGVLAPVHHEGSPRAPVPLWALFASPGNPEGRPTLLFLHGKGGDSTEWMPDALRALRVGYNVLLPDLRGHGRSGGDFFTYGFLEKEDLDEAVEACRLRFGLDPGRLGVHACSAGTVVALEFAARRSGVRALWIESPYSDPRAMARHYLSVATGIPGPLLALPARWAVRAAVARVRRELGEDRSREGLERVDPVRRARDLYPPVLLVYGERDRLVPPRFVRLLQGALPPGSGVWQAKGAGHCHHDDEAQKVAREEYEGRWTEFFSRHLPVEGPLSVIGSAVPEPKTED